MFCALKLQIVAVMRICLPKFLTLYLTILSSLFFSIREINRENNTSLLRFSAKGLKAETWTFGPLLSTKAKMYNLEENQLLLGLSRVGDKKIIIISCFPTVILGKAS